MKELQKIMDKLQSGEHLFLLIGLIQLMEKYCLCSLESQYARHFPIQVMKRIDETREEIEKWAVKWSWNEEKLELSGIGTPQKIITEVLRTGIYVPYCAPGSARKNFEKVKNKVDFAQLVAEAGTHNIDEIPLFDEDNQRVLQLRGDIQINKADHDTLTRVEKKLTKISAALLKCWNDRLTKTNHQSATLEAFGKIHSSPIPTEQYAQMLRQLKNVIKSLPEQDKELFDAETCLPGFIDWNSFWDSAVSNQPIGFEVDPIKNVHTYYEDWFKNSNGRFKEFQDLWENCMIRVTSEAVCETLGSMMNQHGGKNRHLSPSYFSMELVLRYNLGPLHLLNPFIDEILESFGEKFSFIRDESDPEKCSSGDLKVSAAVNTFREQEEKQKSKFPSDFWLKKE